MQDPFDVLSRRTTRQKPFRPRCKACRTNRHVIPVIYSREIDEALLAGERAGELRIGGSARGVDAPNWYCRHCGALFQR